MKKHLMADDPIKNSYIRAQEKWPDIHLEFKQFKSYVREKQQIAIEKMAQKNWPDIPPDFFKQFKVQEKRQITIEKTARKNWTDIPPGFFKQVKSYFQERQQQITIEKMAMEDLYLALALSNKDSKAWEIFYREYGGYIEKIAERVSRNADDADTAKEIVQQFFLKLPLWISVYRGSGSLYGWLGAVISKFAITHLRKIKHHQPLDAVPEDTRSYDFRVKADADECKKLFREMLPKAIDILKPDWQLMIQCKFFDGLTNREIAATVLKTGEYNVSKWLKAAFKKMKKRLLNLAREKCAEAKDILMECLNLLDSL
jgi:RNA polymerase sigma factor (sigma-70 family)